MVDLATLRQELVVELEETYAAAPEDLVRSEAVVALAGSSRHGEWLGRWIYRWQLQHNAIYTSMHRKITAHSNA